jgi:phage shock protein A
MFRKPDLRGTHENLALQILETLHQSKLDDLTKVRRSSADASTNRKRIELQLNSIKQTAEKLKARQLKATEVGRPDLAAEAAEYLAAELQMLDQRQRQYSMATDAENDEMRSSTLLDRQVRSLRNSIDMFKDNRRSSSMAHARAGVTTRTDMPNEAAAGIAIMDEFLPADLRRATD